MESGRVEKTEQVTAGGIRVIRTATPVDSAVKSEVLDTLVAAVGNRRGGVLSSGMEYPGRYSRWHMGYVDPCVEIVARGRRLTVRALNARGRVVLPAISAVVRPTGDLVGETEEQIEIFVAPTEEFFTEEERSRQPTVFTPIREIIRLFACDDPHLGLYGAFGYDLSLQFEPLKLSQERPADQRDLVLHLADEQIVVDRKRETSHRLSYDFVVGGASTEGLPRRTEATPPPRVAELPPQPVPGAYAQVVREAKEKFIRGDLFEVTPGHVMYGRCDSPSAFFERLRELNPAPYEFIFNLGEGEHLVGASPEMFVRVTSLGGGELRVETCPIAGTIRRGADPLQDAEQIRALISSAKDESELTMCTDVDRNDKSRVCVPGTVKVLGRRQIELYSRLIHTVDHIEGKLRPSFDALDAFLTHMWAVTVTGAPKTWAMQFIEDHEATPRRWYGGAVGFVGFDGTMNTGLTLRTAQIRDGIAAVRAGATLLYDSDPDEEERETHLKAGALLGALESVAEPAGAQERPVRPGRGMKVLLVDHEDSFVNTLADYFRQQEADVTTVRHGFPERLLDELAPDLVVLSPGPGRPEDFDTARLLDAVTARDLPVFGVCLGLQAMIEHAGGELALLPEPAHGKPGQVKVAGGALFAGLPDHFTAARYHSLHTTPDRVRGAFHVTALTGDVVMAIEDPAAKRWAVQFHPESILTAAGGAGHQIISNVLTLARR